jgi:pimeloyl-ACP methyl ester carboxylesterase
VLDRHRLESAVVCGVSYGGWIAVRFAALHPHRTRGLILASTPGPRWTPDEHAARYLQAPLVFAPAFAMRSFRRLYREVVVALPERVARRRFVVTHLGRVVRAPTSPVRMAHRIHLARQVDFASSARAVTAPTLLVTGEADLDRVVPVSQTLEYRPLIPHARHVVIERAGHVGAVTRADAFARELRRFAAMDASVDAEPAALETEAG